jgi:alpha/beta superfamily hydrolase
MTVLNTSSTTFSNPLTAELIRTPGEHHLLYPGPVGQIEAVLMIPENPTTQSMAVLGHPHSLQGGSMSNKVVTTMARAFRDVGLRSLRFNFRGVGLTEGQFDHGRGESEDMLAWMQSLKTLEPDLNFVLAGFSFGSYVTHRTACQWTPNWLLSIAPPIERYDYHQDPQCPWVVIQGDADEVVDAQGVFDFVAHYPRPIELISFEHTGHFFHGQLLKLREVVVQCYHRYHS